MAMIHLARQESHCSAELQAYKLNAWIPVGVIIICWRSTMCGCTMVLVIKRFNYCMLSLLSHSQWASSLPVSVPAAVTSLNLDLSSIFHRPGGSSPLAILCICQDISLVAIPEVKLEKWG